MYVPNLLSLPQTTRVGVAMRDDPRMAMAIRLPAPVQPFLTWLTAKPAPGEAPSPKSPVSYVTEACCLVLGGCVVSVLAMELLAAHQPLFWLVLATGLIATTSGLGIFQVVVFHHCAHGTVFRNRSTNRTVGWLVSALLLFKHFDSYRHEHMLHHNANKLFTLEDEFTDFVVGICNLSTATEKRALWRHLLTDLASPLFHARFMVKRVRGSLASHERSHNLFGIAAWSGLLLAALLTHHLGLVFVAWVLPVTVLLQVATVFRILCEHRLPPPEVIGQRGKALVCQATAGVFPGVMPPTATAGSLRGFAAWIGWWANMLTVQLFVRIFVLVGDAPCHDFHHRRAASKRWTDYARARQADFDAGCPGFPLNYIETWGLFRAVDENFAAMAGAPADILETVSKVDRVGLAGLFRAGCVGFSPR